MVSGPGLERIHAALQGPHTPASEIARAALEGNDRLALQALDVFLACYGAVAGDFALTVLARGGVYIAGGIVPRLVEPLGKSEFRARFEAKGRYRDYLAAIPTYLITAQLPAFRGLKYLLGYR